MNSNDDKHVPEKAEYLLPCPECHSGVMRLSYITYFTWLNEELITVPNFPAWVCDVCGRREFDYDAVSWLNALLSPAEGRSPAQTAHRKITPPAAEISNPEEIS